MPSTLIEKFNNRYADRFVRDISGVIGEYAGDTRKGADLAAQSVVDALVRRGAESSGYKSFMDVAKAYPKKLLSPSEVTLDPQANPTGYADMLDQGSALAAALFGRAEAKVIDRVAGHGGLKTSSASVLLKLSTVIIWSMLREELGDRPGQRALTDYLSQQLPLPATIFPPQSDSDFNASLMENPDRPDTRHPDGTFTLRKLLPWVLLMLVTLALFFAVQHGCGG